MKKLIILFLLFIPGSVFALSTNAKSSILIDATSGKVLYENKADERMPMASMTKMMTMLLLMEAIDDGRCKLNDEVLISHNAASMGGSQAYLEENSKMRVDVLLKAIAIASANDAAVAIGEYLFGGLEEAVKEMNKKAKELRMVNTNFKNVHGLDEENHYSSARDMALLAKELIKHDKILLYTSIYEDYIEHENGTSTWVVNTNKLINHYDGLDGLKTGYTENAGYCITATAKKNNLRLISVVMGEESNKQRNEDTIELLNYGFANYKVDKILSIGEYLGDIDIDFGKQDKYKLKVNEDIYGLVNIMDKNSYKYELKLNKIKAPVNKGDVAGYIEILTNDVKTNTVPIYFENDIKKGNLFDFFIKNIDKLLNGFN